MTSSPNPSRSITYGSGQALSFSDAGRTSVHQKLDSLLVSFAEQTRTLSESKAETTSLRNRVEELGSEVKELKRKLEALPDSTPSRQTHIPRELSVSLRCGNPPPPIILTYQLKVMQYQHL